VANNAKTCPRCRALFVPENGHFLTCPNCHASQARDAAYSEQKWRNCLKCKVPFQASSSRMIFCPRCQTDFGPQDQEDIVIWENACAFPRTPTEPSHEDSFLQSTHKSRRTIFQVFLSWWQPNQAALERFCITLWPTSLFTFTKDERRALRLASRGSYQFQEINDPRIAKWLTRRGILSALRGLETLRPDIARQIVQTPDSLRLSGINYLDESLAHSLARHRGRTLYLDNLQHVDIEVLEILITHGGRGLSLGGIKHLSIQEASVLARYRGRLSLNSLSNLNSEVLSALVQHVGKSLSLASLKTLSLPQAQQLKQYRGDLYLRGIQELPPGMNSEFIDFPGKIVLMHHERRSAKTHASVETTTEDLGARIALGVVAFACIAALFALVVAAFSNL